VNKKKYILGVVALLLLSVSLSLGHLSATAGKLQSHSICRNGGVTYGWHGDGHWHQAIKHRTGWYPDGDSLGYASPCTSGGGSYSASSGRSSSYKETEQEVKVERSAPKLEAKVTKVEKFFPQLKRELTVADLVALFDVRAMDSEEGDISSKIVIAGAENLVLENRDAHHKIVFNITNSAGQKSE